MVVPWWAACCVSGGFFFRAVLSRSSAALEPLSSRPDWLLGQLLQARKSGPDAHTTPHEQCPNHQRRSGACERTIGGLRCALSAARRRVFASAGAQARRVWLTHCCLPAVCQIPSSCSAVQRPCPSVRPRARAMLLRAFPGRLVQRWPRTRRSSDPLQMRARRLYFRPKAQIDPRELESGVGMLIRSRADELVCPPRPSLLATPRPRMHGSAHLARRVG